MTEDFRIKFSRRELAKVRAAIRKGVPAGVAPMDAEYDGGELYRKQTGKSRSGHYVRLWSQWGREPGEAADTMTMFDLMDDSEGMPDLVAWREISNPWPYCCRVTLRDPYSDYKAVVTVEVPEYDDSL